MAEFPMADPGPPVVIITAPCGCAYLDLGRGGPPAQVAWCPGHESEAPA